MWTVCQQGTNKRTLPYITTYYDLSWFYHDDPAFSSLADIDCYCLGQPVGKIRPLLENEIRILPGSRNRQKHSKTTLPTGMRSRPAWSMIEIQSSLPNSNSHRETKASSRRSCRSYLPIWMPGAKGLCKRLNTKPWPMSVLSQDFVFKDPWATGLDRRQSFCPRRVPAERLPSDQQQLDLKAGNDLEFLFKCR